jgi:hypothetical protein
MVDDLGKYLTGMQQQFKKPIACSGGLKEKNHTENTRQQIKP